MYPPTFSLNLYTDFVIAPEVDSQLREWTRVVENEPELPPIRWHLRLERYIRHASIGASVRIEGNQLSVGQADALLEGENVSASPDDRQEIINYRDALDLATRFALDPGFEWSEFSIRAVNGAIMRGLEDDTLGQYRREPIGVGGVYRAPDHHLVPALMECLVQWLRGSDAHPLVRAALLHLNLVAIHPWLNGNGRTARVLTALELMRQSRAPELISIEPALLEQQGTYYARIREAVGPHYSPDRHSVTEWVTWYVSLHTERLEAGRRLLEAYPHDIGTITAALERRGDPLDWGPLLHIAAMGFPLRTRMVTEIFSSSPSTARALLARLVDAGWLESRGRTRGAYHVATARTRALQLRVPSLLRELTPEQLAAFTAITDAGIDED
jgi:Fic family protein